MVQVAPPHGIGDTYGVRSGGFRYTGKVQQYPTQYGQAGQQNTGPKAVNLPNGQVRQLPSIHYAGVDHKLRPPTKGYGFSSYVVTRCLSWAVAELGQPGVGASDLKDLLRTVGDHGRETG